MPKVSAAESAIRKLEEFYKGLKADEQKVIALIVSSSLQRAARAQVERDWLKDGEVLLDLISPKHAPDLVATMGQAAAGQLAARAVAGQMALREIGSIRAEKKSTK
jgi:hypothetical protein